VRTRDAQTGAEVWRADFSAMRVVLMRDAKSGEQASVVALRGDDGRADRHRVHDQVRRRARANVANSGLGVFAPVPEKITERFPAVTDPASLCRISRELIRRRYREVNVATPDDGGDPAAYLTAAMREELAGQVGTGYCRWDEAGQTFRPTWKGAVLMTWKLLPPFLQIRESRMRWRADRLMMEVGVAHWTASDSRRAVS
jgi:hypothetical protein